MRMADRVIGHAFWRNPAAPATVRSLRMQAHLHRHSILQRVLGCGHVNGDHRQASLYGLAVDTFGEQSIAFEQVTQCTFRI
jgi:hypothetical protein